MAAPTTNSPTRGGGSTRLSPIASTRFQTSPTQSISITPTRLPRLAKAMRAGKVTLTCLWLGTGAAVCATAPDTQTRACVARASSPAAILGCERAAAERWRASIADYDRILQARLAGAALDRYRAAQAAWQDFAEAEFGLIDETLGRRGDASGTLLAAGARSLLLQQRAEQLGAHLAGLPAPGAE